MFHRGTEEYTEYYNYVLEAKLYLHAGVQISILTEFVENEGKEADKQGCERKAATCLMEKLKKEFPLLPKRMCGDSLYACGHFFRNCQKKGWRYLLRCKRGIIPSIYKEYETLKKADRNRLEERQREACVIMIMWSGVDYNGFHVNVVKAGGIKIIYKTG